MDDRNLRILEFNKIREILKKYVEEGAAKDIIDDLAPYDNIYEVRKHIEETREASELLMKNGRPPFEGIYDAREEIIKAKKEFTLLPFQLLKIAGVLRCARNFKSYISHKDEEKNFSEIEDICSGLCPLKKLEDDIFTAIENENEVSDRASSELSRMRRSLKDKNASVKDKVNSMVRTYSKYLQDNLYTIRGERYVLPVKAENKSFVPGLVHDQSASGATLFIEPMGLVNLNNEIKELMLKEKAEVEKILRELSLKVNENINAVKINADILYELDFVFAKAKYGNEINAFCPRVDESCNFEIIEGKHPLIDRERVVPISVSMNDEFSSIVITGPNTGGKTVTLKTIGLFHIMGMSGLMIPAREGSTIGFFTKVFADIGDEQSIEQNLSTFSSHMTNIVHIIDEADEKSLVLFDELGAGTDPMEGAALAVSILENLKKNCVKIVATTHYSELKAYALNTDGVENASVEFDVKTLRPTYRLLQGIPGKSNAFEISKRLGLPDYIIDIARKSMHSDALRFEELIQNLQDRNMKAEEEKCEAETLRRKAEIIKNQYEDKIQNFDNLRNNVLDKAKKEAQKMLGSAKDEADNILKNIRDLEKMGYSTDVKSKLEEQRRKIREKIDSIDDGSAPEIRFAGDPIKNVKIGEEYFLPSLNQKVSVLSFDKAKNKVLVQAGIMKIDIKISDLRESNNKIKNRNVSKHKREANLNLRNVASSVDLRGMDAQEAVYTTDKYLDDAFIAGLTEVTIIHGKGTGVLKKAINDMLRGHSNIKSYRIGEYGEGGSGVTIVYFK